MPLTRSRREFRRAITGVRRPGSSYDSEAGQALVRILITVFVTSYVLLGISMGRLDSHAARFFAYYMTFFFAVSCCMFLVVRYWPGVNHLRRAFCIALDFGSIVISIIVGGPYMAPLLAVLLWVTVGYGMRYGSHYLAAATMAALLSFALIGGFSPFWQSQPYLLGSFVLTSLIVPLYANLLLIDTREAYRAASAANLAKSRFLAQASHDLRQPIHAISLFTSCLREAGLKPDDREMVESIDRSLQALNRMFRSLLDVAVLDSGKISVRPEAVALGDLLAELMAQNAEAAQRGKVELRLVGTRLCVQSDPALLAVMLQNILGNALKYAPGGKVLIGCRRNGDTASICVADQGAGVAPEHQPHLFDEFYRAPLPGHDVEGMGLGLSIVARMARLLDIGVDLRSVPGRGTTVVLAGLPLTDERPKPRPVADAPPPSLLRGLRIILIDDDPAVLSSTRSLMERWGCRVQAFAGPVGAAGPCDVIIADFDLNGPVSGADVIAGLRAGFGWRVPAIIITAHDPERVRARLDDPETKVMPKPVRASELRSVLVAGMLDRGS